MSNDDDGLLVWNGDILFQGVPGVPCGCVIRHGKRWLWWARDEDGVFHGPQSSLPAGDCATQDEAKETCERRALQSPRRTNP
jgi:hypothetical protein